MWLRHWLPPPRPATGTPTIWSLPVLLSFSIFFLSFLHPTSPPLRSPPTASFMACCALFPASPSPNNITHDRSSLRSILPSGRTSFSPSPIYRYHFPRGSDTVTGYNLSHPLLEEASLLFNKQGPIQRKLTKKLAGRAQGCVGNAFPLTNNFGDMDMAVIGLEAMQRANSTLEDFCRSYFMFHGMDVNKPQSIFKYLPLLSFTESYIYQMDRLNEQIINMPTSGVTAMERVCEEANKNSKFIDLLRTDPFRPLAGQLECLGLLTRRIREEFTAGEEYWALERKLCSALMNKKEISVEEVMRAMHLRSADFRMLNLLLYKLRGANVNDLHMEFLSISELRLEIFDDLLDYEDDVLENTFNVLRMFVAIYGPSAAPEMLAKLISDAEEKYDTLLRTLDPELSLNCKKRFEEALKEERNASGHNLGTWSIPPVIVDEESYRSRC